MIGFVHFRVKFRDSLDPAQVIHPPAGSEGRASCLKVDSYPPKLKVLKIEPVKGGVGKWDGVIASMAMYANLRPSMQTILKLSILMQRMIGGFKFFTGTTFSNRNG